MPTGGGGRPRGVRISAMEEEVIQRTLDNSRTSTRRIAREMDVSHVLVHKVLKEEKLYSYHFTLVQKLIPRDYPTRVIYSRKILERVAIEPEFLRRVLWTDECTFTQDGYFNFHNYHYYGYEYPFLMWDGNSQFSFKVNVWAGLIDDQLVSTKVLIILIVLFDTSSEVDHVLHATLISTAMFIITVVIIVARFLLHTRGTNIL